MLNETDVLLTAAEVDLATAGSSSLSLNSTLTGTVVDLAAFLPLFISKVDFIRLSSSLDSPSYFSSSHRFRSSPGTSISDLMYTGPCFEMYLISFPVYGPLFNSMILQPIALTKLYFGSGKNSKSP